MLLTPWSQPALWSTAVSVVLVYKLLNLARYVLQARRTGLPYTIVPILETEVVGKLLTPLLRPLFTNRLFHGRGWPRWIRFTILDWAWEEKRRVHEELGEVFLVISPEGIICYSSDADMSWDVMNRRNEFIKPRDKYKVFEPYGPNVTTTEGKEYNFHVRITAPPFSDGSGANDLVWEEAARQARQLTASWARGNTQRDLSVDVNRLTLGVMACVGFGKKMDFQAEISSTKSNVPPGYQLSLHHSLHLVTTYIVRILLLPKWIMRAMRMGEIATAHEELERYIREMIETETKKLHSAGSSDHLPSDGKKNLLVSVLHASAEEGAASGRKQAFTEDEVLGNLFVYLLAGYETTANAIMYGFITLALRPDLQDRIMAEVDLVYEGAQNQGRSELSYTEDFEKFEYTYAFMYEIFRLYPMVLIITKMVPQDTIITIYPENEPPRQHILPADCRVYLNVSGVHYHERYWPEPTTIQPERWMSNSITVRKGDAIERKKVVAADKTRQVRGTLLTFSGGARACLGRKFAQSEYISVLATVLREYRITLAADMDPATVQQEINNLAAGTITLSPSKTVKLTLQKREKRQS